VSDGWSGLVDELTASIEGTGRAPVLGVGHSLGGFLTFMAAVRRPDLFRALILLDAPLLGRFQGSALQFVKRIGLIDRVTPAGSTRNRRRVWPSAEAALEYFRRKPLFGQFDPDCLLDYVRYGTVPAQGGVELVFDPGIEYRIYRTIPHDLASFASRLKPPGGFIYGRDSDVVRRAGLTLTRRTLHVTQSEGGHMFPFQVPHHAANAIRALAGTLMRL
jgi:pimeloyl-ACP methyl ester carboxylesterase